MLCFGRQNDEVLAMKHSAIRALSLLRAMNQRPLSTVKELALETGISKPSIVRLLAIMMDDGYVCRTARRGTYALGPSVRLLSAGYRDDMNVEATVGPLLDALTREIGWPSALGTPDRADMVVRHSTIPTSPLAWYHTTLHRRLPMLRYAMGLVYLAHVPPPVRDMLLKMDTSPDISGSDRSADRFQMIREAGFAIRTPTPDHPTLSVSVPILIDGQVVAALSITVYGNAMTPKEAVERHIERLRAAAQAISERWISRPAQDL